MGLLTAAFIATAALACGGSTKGTNDPDFGPVCDLAEQIGDEYDSDAVNDPIGRLAAAAPTGTEIKRTATAMAALDLDVREQAIKFADLSQALDRELEKACAGDEP
jgi:hypothetical protein